MRKTTTYRMKKLLLERLIIFCLGGIMISLSGQAQDCASGYCPETLLAHHYAGVVSAETVTIQYPVVESSLSGSTRCWVARNLGATVTATDVADARAEAAGWFWQFNRQQGYVHDGSTLSPAWTITTINELADWLVSNDPCRLLLGGTWRLPTSDEWTTTISGWTTATNAYQSVLKLHEGGLLSNSSGALGTSRGERAGFWSSKQSSTTNANYLLLNGTSVSVATASKAIGAAVRCVREP